MSDHRQGEQTRFDRDDPGFDRAIAFVDATYALALTLLVTTLDVDDPGAAWGSVDALYDAIGAQLVAFLIAFVVISSYWLEHHRLITRFAAIDYPTITANIALSGSIVLLPFSTRAVGDPDVQGLALPVIFMALNVALTSILYTVVYLMAVRRRLLDEQPSAARISSQTIISSLPAAVFLVSIPVAVVVSAGAAQLVWVSLVFLNPVAGFITRRLDPPTPSAG